MRFSQSFSAKQERTGRRSTAFLLALLLLFLHGALAGCGSVGDGGAAPSRPGTDAPSDFASGSSDRPSGVPSGVPSEGDGPAGGALVYRAPEKTLENFSDFEADGTLIVAVDERCGGILGKHPLLGASYEDVNAAIRERFGAEVYLQSYPPDDLLARAGAAGGSGSAGGGFFADLLAIPLASLPEYLAADLLMPLSELPGFASLALEASADGKMDGVLLSCTREMAVDGQCYALFGSGALSELGGVCLLFNHTLLDALADDRPDLYKEVKNGSFTWERLFSLLKTAEETLASSLDGGSGDTSGAGDGGAGSADAAAVFENANAGAGDVAAVSKNANNGSGNGPAVSKSANAGSGNGSAVSENAPGETGKPAQAKAAIPGYEGETISLFGTTLSQESFRAAIYRSCGASLATDAAAGGFSLDALDALATTSDGLLTGDAAAAAFREGNLLFLVTTLDALYDHPNSDGSWGCLPLPKLREDDAHVTPLDPASTTVFVAPKGAGRLEMKSGYLLALFAASRCACLPAFAHELLAGFIREGDSMEMLPGLLAGVTADRVFRSRDAERRGIFAALDAALAGIKGETSGAGDSGAS